MPTANPLYPLNDFVRHVLIELVHPVTGVRTPCVDGEVTAFLAASNSPDATAADPAWTADGVYIGGANDFPDGTWQFQIDATVLTLEKCNEQFSATVPPYFIVERVNAIRAVEKLKYVKTRLATITTEP